MEACLVLISDLKTQRGLKGLDFRGKGRMIWGSLGHDN